jgi:hypothetical protein
MQKLGRSLVLICLLTLGGCGWGGPSYWLLGQYQGHIEHGSLTIETAQDDTGRAAGHTERARRYAERARYTRVFNQDRGSAASDWLICIVNERICG